MSTIQKRTFSLSEEQSHFIDDQVARGGYASASEVIRAGVRALQERDEAVERWLREEVAQTYDAMKADPSRAIPAEEMFSQLREHAARRLKAEQGDT